MHTNTQNWRWYFRVVSIHSKSEQIWSPISWGLTFFGGSGRSMSYLFLYQCYITNHSETQLLKVLIYWLFIYWLILMGFTHGFSGQLDNLADLGSLSYLRPHLEPLGWKDSFSRRAEVYSYERGMNFNEQSKALFITM